MIDLKDVVSTLDGADDVTDPSTLLAALGLGAPGDHDLTATGDPDPLELDASSRESGAPDFDGLAPDRFTGLAELGRGGMGRVVLARDVRLRREVAIKVLLDPSQLSRSVLVRFVAEARVTAQLEHPNIVPVYDFGLTPTGQLYIVMRRIEGEPLSSILKRVYGGDLGDWTLHRLLRVFVAIAHAIAYAHSRGVLHRDLKPANVMVGPFGEVLVLDWGIARLLHRGPDGPQPAVEAPVHGLGAQLTQVGAAVGTPGYMSPEQARGEAELVDERADVYSLGCLLHEILCGEKANTGPTPLARLFDSITLPPDPSTRPAPWAVDADLGALCLRCLAPDRNERVGSAAALAEEIERFLEGAAGRARAEAQASTASGLLADWSEAVRRTAQLESRLAQLADRIPAAAPLAAKAPLFAVRVELDAARDAEVDAFSDVIGAGEQALAHDAGSAAGRKILSAAYFARFEQAEAMGDRASQRFFRDRVLRYDDGTFGPRLERLGVVSLATDPPGIVDVARFVADDAVLRLAPQGSGLVSPLHDVELPSGSYLLTLRSPGRADVRYPLHLGRRGRWDGGRLVFPQRDAVPEGFVYVPPGPFRHGGDSLAQEAWPAGSAHEPGFLIAVHPVTQGDWCVFINAMHLRDPDQAWARVPRRDSGGGLKNQAGQFWAPPDADGYVVPARDQDGDPWDPGWPVFAISWEDAQAYCAWWSARDGIAWSLPTERKWEKAARGVDGRAFPWGDVFDPALCVMRNSAGRPQPRPVGAAPNDVSVYGVRDMGGTIREWCAEADYDGDPTRRPVRGGSWATIERLCRCASRYGQEHWLTPADLGMRLCRAWEPGESDPDAP